MELPKEKQIEQLHEVIDIYTRLLNYPEWDKLIEIANSLCNNITIKLLGRWDSPKSGCANFEEYKYFEGHLHGILKVINTPNEMIKEAKARLLELEKDK